MFAGRPIIGIAGGIGSGKSFVASCFAELGCGVIDSDALVRTAYEETEVRQTLVSWWGLHVLRDDGSIDRAAVGRRVFANTLDRVRLEQFIHPRVGVQRERMMESMARNASVVAFVWDAPLLFETGLDKQCDAIVFVDSLPEARLERVMRTRRWGPEELALRENSQWPLDKKRILSEYVVTNTADAGHVRDQVRGLLPRILLNTALG